jgi:hypothetical protein
LPPQPREWFGNLIRGFGDRLTIRIAAQEGRAIGALLTLRQGHTLVYKYGASDAAFHHLGTMPFLFWKTIQNAQLAGVRYLDLGRSDLDNGGLIAFKERLGAVPASLTYIRYAARRRRSAPRRMRMPATLLSLLPDPLFVAAGRLLYRHMG